jgi:Uma2 family endonuclease
MVDQARVASVAEYLALEANSDAKHEYLGGIVVAMAGASPRHNVIATNVATILAQQLASTPCRVFNSDQRVRVEETGAYVYPDVTVACDAPRFTDERPRSLTNPMVVVEVLSPSTERLDRGSKLAHYRRLASVREVILVEPNERRVEHYRRLDGGRWLITDVTEGAIALDAVAVELSLDEVYAKTSDLPVDTPTD